MRPSPLPAALATTCGAGVSLARAVRAPPTVSYLFVVLILMGLASHRWRTAGPAGGSSSSPGSGRWCTACGWWGCPSRSRPSSACSSTASSIAPQLVTGRPRPSAQPGGERCSTRWASTPSAACSSWGRAPCTSTSGVRRTSPARSDSMFLAMLVIVLVSALRAAPHDWRVVALIVLAIGWGALLDAHYTCGCAPPRSVARHRDPAARASSEFRHSAESVSSLPAMLLVAAIAMAFIAGHRADTRRRAGVGGLPARRTSRTAPGCSTTGSPGAYLLVASPRPRAS